MIPPRSIVLEAGLTPDDRDRVRERAWRAEVLAARQLNARVRDERPFATNANRGPDLELPDGRLVEVKSVPTLAYRFVSAGDVRPTVPTVVVWLPDIWLRVPGSRAPEPGIVGFVLPEAWQYGLPPLPPVPGLTPRPTWFVPRDAVTPWSPAR
jgi:hypothetical protein